MRNIALKLAYKGGNYSGWQSQKNAVGVCDVLSDALEKVIGARPTIYGCGRTDAGVHALNYVCNFKSQSCISITKLPKALNFYLPRDISVQNAAEVPEDFNARFSAVSKEYAYKIYNSKIDNPFYLGYALRICYNIDIEALNKCCEAFIGTHDFRAFMSSNSNVSNTVRQIYECRFIEKEDMYEFHISGNGFLYNMVRIIVGTLLFSKGEIGRSDIEKIILSGDRKLAGKTVAPYGLYLLNVKYPDGFVI